jgi:type VI secretion system lysozyme-like protein
MERIARGSGPSRGRAQASAVEDLDALMESVRVNLARILNARHGMSEALPDYGIPALTDMTIGSGDYVQIMQSAISTAIEKYEPRLRRIRVSQVIDEDRPKTKQTLAFRVDGVLVSQSGQHRVWYETSIAGTGEFDVSA